MNRENPIIIKNNYLIKKELLVVAFLAPIIIVSFFCLLYANITRGDTAKDKLDASFATYGIMLALSSILVMIYVAYKTFKHKRVELFIKIYDDKIDFDYLTTKYEKKTFILKKNEITSVKYGFFPYSQYDEKDEIWITDYKKDRLGTFIFMPIQFLISSVYLCLFIFINRKFEKYVYLRFNGGIISIPKNDFPNNKNIKFEWKSLFNCQILGGQYYAK